MPKLFIKNRKNQKIAVLLEEAKPQKGLAFVMHGLSGFKEQPHIQAMAEALLENGYTVVRFDTTNTFGESEGDYEKATITNYYEDLEDVINWAEAQKWYQEPFILAGHSLGGICTALYAEKYPDKVKALAPISTAVSGKLMKENYARQSPDFLKKWQEQGYYETPSVSKPGIVKRTGWLFLEDSLQYDLLSNISKINVPILLVVGEKDTSTPISHQQILFRALSRPKELHIIKGAPHTFRDKDHLAELKKIFNEWLKNLN